MTTVETINERRLRYEAQDILDAAINAGDGGFDHLDRGARVAPIATARALRLIELGLRYEAIAHSMRSA